MTAFAQDTDLPSGQDEATQKQTALAQATDLIRGELGGQVITRVDDDVVTLPGHGRRILQLPQIPVVSVASVVVRRGTGSDWNWVQGIDYVVRADGQLEALGYCWPRGWDVVVTYTHGYDTVPGDLVRLCAKLADRILDGSLQFRSVQESIGSKQSTVTYLQPASGRAEVFSEADDRVLDQFRLTFLP